MQLMLWPKRESPVTVNHCQPGKSWSRRSRQSVGQQLPNGLNHCHNSLPLLFLTTGRHCLVLPCLSIHPPWSALVFPQLKPSFLFILFRLFCTFGHLRHFPPFWLFLDALPLPSLATIHATPSISSYLGFYRLHRQIHLPPTPLGVPPSCRQLCNTLLPLPLELWAFFPCPRTSGTPISRSIPSCCFTFYQPCLIIFALGHHPCNRTESWMGLYQSDSPQSFISSSCSLDFASLPSTSLPTRDRAVSGHQPSASTFALQHLVLLSLYLSPIHLLVAGRHLMNMY